MSRDDFAALLALGVAPEHVGGQVFVAEDVEAAPTNEFTKLYILHTTDVAAGLRVHSHDLARLYGVSLDNCIVIYDEDRCRYKLLGYNNLTHLWPRQDGLYPTYEEQPCS